jgi:hypothetical protein
MGGMGEEREKRDSLTERERALRVCVKDKKDTRV